MNNEPVAWGMTWKDGEIYDVISPAQHAKEEGDYTVPLYTQDQLEKARKLGMQQERALWNLSTSTQEIMDTHPVKELHLSLQKSKQTGELLAVTYTDDEHRIVEVLWQRPPVKELTNEEIADFTHRMVLCCGVHPNSADINVLGLKFIVEDILRKAQEK
jgi:hypothetical protein